MLTLDPPDACAALLTNPDRARETAPIRVQRSTLPLALALGEVHAQAVFVTQFGRIGARFTPQRADFRSALVDQELWSLASVCCRHRRHNRRHPDVREQFDFVFGVVAVAFVDFGFVRSGAVCAFDGLRPARVQVFARRRYERGEPRQPEVYDVAENVLVERERDRGRDGWPAFFGRDVQVEVRRKHRRGIVFDFFFFVRFTGFVAADVFQRLVEDLLPASSNSNVHE